VKFFLKIASIILVFSTDFDAMAGDQFGTADDAERLADALIDIIDGGGLVAGKAAVVDPNGPFQTTEMGIHIFDSGVIIADSRDPELLTVSYSGVTDLNGADFWDAIVDAANGSNFHKVKWYSYSNENSEYIFDCYSKWQTQDIIVVWICY